jgi:arylsulfatase A-like enzyme
VVFLTSDHGFHVGGKESIYKQTLWDSGTRIPLIIAGLKGMARGVTCHQPVSLIDVFPTFVDICGLPDHPNDQVGRSRYKLEGHSIKPLLLDPKGDWSGPEVAIMTLPGKDHSQHREHVGTLYPHFSVRAKDWRYSLTSDGQEELYHYPSDPNEFTNLADNPEHAEMKATLRAQLVVLRDGDQWKDYEGLPKEEVSAFELLAEVKGGAELKLGSNTVASVETNTWTPIRVRVAGKRSQVWLDNKVYSDEVGLSDLSAGKLTSDGAEWRQIRIRKL